jgi:SAM-dependent methyltransferase
VFASTVSKLRCPVESPQSNAVAAGHQACGGGLKLLGKTPVSSEILKGTLQCQSCHAQFPILAGVAIVVGDVASYILQHVKGISKLVSEDEIPIEVREDFIDAKSEIEAEHIEEDLEADRVVSLYVMNHYLRVGSQKELPAWARPDQGSGSRLIEKLIRENWDRGPFSQIVRWCDEFKTRGVVRSVIEIGSGVGGLYPAIRNDIQTYLGVDSSFASVAIARHLALGAPYPRKIQIPGDLLQGAVSREIVLNAVQSNGSDADFVVGEMESLPVARGDWDLTIALNAIDMMPEPAILPELQYELLKKGGLAIQSCPYIWHEQVARELRAALPKEVKDSAQAVEWLYEKAGFEIEDRVEHLPWLFFKHLRQLEIYSVHIFKALKS